MFSCYMQSFWALSLYPQNIHEAFVFFTSKTRSLMSDAIHGCLPQTHLTSLRTGTKLSRPTLSLCSCLCPECSPLHCFPLHSSPLFQLKCHLGYLKWPLLTRLLGRSAFTPPQFPFYRHVLYISFFPCLCPCPHWPLVPPGMHHL